jgi:hypothetical protein
MTVQQLALPVALSLPGGLSVLVDEQDAEWLARYRWRAIRIRHTWYAVRDDGETLIYMHREIIGAPAGAIVDHIDGNGLNNQRCNLRLVTPGENAINAAKRAGCSSRHRGVDWCKSMRAWRARVWCGGREQLVGYYATEKEAAEARMRAALAVYGEYVARRWG